MQASLVIFFFLTNHTAPNEKCLFFSCGRLDKKCSLAAVRSEIHLTVSLPPALLCYDTSNIWSALYVFEAPRFPQEEISNQRGGQLRPEGS